MRPSDENQASRLESHVRPNLMSSGHRGSHEDSILAKLEREPARRGKRATALRLAWYGSASALAIGLVAVLAWLAAGTGPAPLTAAGSGDARQAAASVPAQAAAAIAEAGTAFAAPAETALIVDEAPLAAAPLVASAAGAAPPPPLRLLEPASVPVPAPVPASEKAMPAAARAGPAHSAAPARASPARARAPAARQPGRAARVAKQASPARDGEHDDSDVALISAVIYHANGHATTEKSDAGPAGCTGEGCRPAPAR